MKIIFLDVDGVLNSARSFIAGHSAVLAVKNDNLKYYEKITSATIDGVAVNLVNRICNLTGSKLVISSSHRLHFMHRDDILGDMKEYFSFLGIDKDLIIGYTDNHGKLRGQEIERWLKAHPSVTHYVILDDSDDMLNEQINNFIRVDSENGLSHQDYRRACTILGAPDTGLILI